MALLSFTGFETGDASDMLGTVGTFSVQNSVVRTGGYALRCNPTTTGTGYVIMVGLGTNGQVSNLSNATLYATFYFRYATKPTSNEESICKFVTKEIELKINSSGQLSVWVAGGGSQLGSTGSTALSADTWYRIEFSCDGSGSWAVQIDGTAEISGTSSQTSSAMQVYFGKSVNYNNNTVDFFYDDIWIDSSTFRGAFEVKRMGPNGNGSYTAWTGTYTDVDEVVSDGNTSYIESATSGQAETVALESGATAGITGTVHAVKSVSIWREEPSGTSSIQTRLRSSSTDNDTVARNGNTTFAFIAKNYETDPATSAAWLLSALDSVEVGVVNGANVNVRCTLLCAMVAYTPSTGSLLPHLGQLSGGMQTLGL